MLKAKTNRGFVTVCVNQCSITDVSETTNLQDLRIKYSLLCMLKYSSIKTKPG